MSGLGIFTQESRQEIVNSIINTSTSKQSYTFSKQKRFKTNNTNCPYISYYNDIQSKALKKGNPGFGSAERRVFAETSEGPSSWIYEPQNLKGKQSVNLAKGREEIAANSYINPQLVKFPGPGNYDNSKERSVSYSMRPQTSKEKTYFIKNQEQAYKPGPGAYQKTVSNFFGKNTVSKFKSSSGGSSMNSRSTRFKTEGDKTPCSWNYNKSVKIEKQPGGRFGGQYRYAFTDKTANNSFAPGPGNYKLPSDFGHYRNIKQLH